MLTITDKERVEEYYNFENLSQSLLKKLDRSISQIQKQVDSSKSYIKIGQAVDTILTGEEGQFDKDFYVMSCASPSDAIQKIIKLVYEKVIEDYMSFLEEGEPDEEVLFPLSELTPLNEFSKGLEENETYILNACEEVKYGQSYKEETRLKKVLAFNEYYSAMLSSHNKTILSVEEKEIIDFAVNSLKTNPRTKKYFNREAIAKDESVEVIYQYPIYFSYKEVSCKCLLDIVVLRKGVDGTILSAEPIDLKTMAGDTFYFHNSLMSFRYDIQAMWYTIGLKSAFPGIEIKPFKFIVESNASPGKPLMYEVTEEILTFAMEGNQYKPGINTLFDRYCFYMEHGFKEEKEIVEANNEPLKLGLNGIISREFDSQESVNWESI